MKGYVLGNKRLLLRFFHQTKPWLLIVVATITAHARAGMSLRLRSDVDLLKIFSHSDSKL